MSADRPLAGRRVLLTRGREKEDRLLALLERAGATVVHVPLIASVRLASDASIRAALARLRERGGATSSRQWLVLTSATAVGLMLEAAGRDALGGLAIAVVGPATATAVRAHDLEPELVAAGQEAEALAAELCALGVAGTAVLVVEAAGGRDVIAPVLAEAGAEVEALVAYRTVMPDGAAEALRRELDGAPVDAVIFSSGSTVRHFAQALTTPPAGTVAVCIGPVTATAARQAGWGTVVTAAEHTSAGLFDAVVVRLRGAQPLP